MSKPIDATIAEVNAPLLAQLFKLLDTSALPNGKGNAIYTMHKYVEDLLDYYVNDCFDSEAIRLGLCRVEEGTRIANGLHARSSGLARLLAYLGAEEDAKVLTEYAETLVNAYCSLRG